ncbi:CKLF-like MARVEL transmembrane domain-containing protein 3 [Boleophthalmus pectinirostris]|uniref:CKLF-like MARVEL transmembrane domain-containing protein 3 n=1 Tax=Boleophthalmus pectinirostris TaxID=150288 RepID=UPI000A1C2DA4|nr:CKLF-like MARVEL transmembrane domain-containing protein 3 [Boleophthalmus pectinirostris]
MGDIEARGSNDAPSSPAVLMAILPSKEFSTSKKGMLLTGEVVTSFIDFVCFAASSAAGFVTVPLIEFLGALFILFAYSTKFNERFKGFLWPLMDFLRCVTASIIYFIVSIIAISNYRDGASNAAGVFGFIATIIFALDFYKVFIELAEFLKQGGESREEATQEDKYSESDEDSD